MATIPTLENFSGSSDQLPATSWAAPQISNAVGEGFQELGAAGTHVADKMRQRAHEDMASTAELSFLNKAAATTSQFEQVRGAGVHDQVEQTNQTLQDAYQKTADSISSPEARQLYKNNAMRNLRLYSERVEGHYNTEMKSSQRANAMDLLNAQAAAAAQLITSKPGQDWSEVREGVLGTITNAGEKAGNVARLDGYTNQADLDLHAKAAKGAVADAVLQAYSGDGQDSGAMRDALKELSGMSILDKPAQLTHERVLQRKIDADDAKDFVKSALQNATRTMKDPTAPYDLNATDDNSLSQQLAALDASDKFDDATKSKLHNQIVAGAKLANTQIHNQAVQRLANLDKSTDKQYDLQWVADRDPKLFKQFTDNRAAHARAAAAAQDKQVKKLDQGTMDKLDHDLLVARGTSALMDINPEKAVLDYGFSPNAQHTAVDRIKAAQKEYTSAQQKLLTGATQVAKQALSDTFPKSKALQGKFHDDAVAAVVEQVKKNPDLAQDSAAMKKIVAHSIEYQRAQAKVNAPINETWESFKAAVGGTARQLPEDYVPDLKYKVRTAPSSHNPKGTQLIVQGSQVKDMLKKGYTLDE